MSQCHIGFVGLGVMGQNLALNVESKGFSVAVNDRVQAKMDRFIAQAFGEKPDVSAVSRGAGRSAKKTKIDSINGPCRGSSR